MAPTLKTRKQLLEDAISRFLAVQDRVTYLGANSVARALLDAAANLAQGSYQLLASLYRRYTLQASSGDYLLAVAQERGAGDRRPATSAKMAVVLRPAMANVTAITPGVTDLIEVDDSSPFAALDSIRVRNGDGTVTETASIIAITIGTGPGGGDELEVLPLAGAYTPGVEDVDVLLRVTVPAGTVVTTSAGVSFETLDVVTTGDAVPIMDGESRSLGLADKVWAEAQVAGVAGNVDALTVTGLQPAVPGVIDVFNPAPATGGLDEETDLELKYRTAHVQAPYAQETAAWMEALAQQASEQVLRLVMTTDRAVGTIQGALVKRNGGTFSASELEAIEDYIESRVRSYMAVELSNLTLTAIEVEARITLHPGFTLEQVWKAGADALVQFLDYRKWGENTAVDEAALVAILVRVPGVRTLETSSFLPAADVAITGSLPVLARLSLQDITSTATINAELAVGF